VNPPRPFIDAKAGTSGPRNDRISTLAGQAKMAATCVLPDHLR